MRGPVWFRTRLSYVLFFRKLTCSQGHKVNLVLLKSSCSSKSFVNSTYQRYNHFFHSVHKELLYFPNLDPQDRTPAHQNSVSRCPCHECKLPLLARPVLDYCYRIPFVHFLHVEQGTSIQGCVFVFDLAFATVFLKRAGKRFQPLSTTYTYDRNEPINYSMCQL